MDWLEKLQRKVYATQQEKYPVESRLHPLNSFPRDNQRSCFVKRDDELGFGISGNKIRKYRTLIPQLHARGCKECVVIGGPYSNNVLSIVQLLIENNITPTLFLRGSEPITVQGNYLFLKMLLPPTSFHYIPRDKWEAIDSIIAGYVQGRLDCTIIPEGAACEAAFPGALTLPLDIIRNEVDHALTFDHIFVDVGTGFSAAALLLSFAYLRKKCRFHLLTLAEDAVAFRAQLVRWHKYFEAWFEEPIPLPMAIDYTCYTSTLAPSFGSTNTKLIDYLVQFARNEGFFLDPVYSVKLFYEAEKILSENRAITGNILLLHSGGALSLSGFQKPLERALRNGVKLKSA